MTPSALRLVIQLLNEGEKNIAPGVNHAKFPALSSC
jgi:hypothetical protein